MWFGGEIPSAIGESRLKKSIFVVVVFGHDGPSQTASTAWESKDVSDYIREKQIVAVKLESGSTTCEQFSAIYPVVCVPIGFLIGLDGKPLEVIPGEISAEDLLLKLQAAQKKHEDGLQQRDGAATIKDHNANDAPSSSQVPVSSAPVAEASHVADNEASEGSKRETEQSQLSLEERERRMREIIAEKHRQKAAEAFEKEKEEEIKRREMGKQMTQVKATQEERERREIAEQRRKQREMDQEALRRVREQIAHDRREKSGAFRSEQEVKKEAVQKKREERDLEEKRRIEERMNIAKIQFRVPNEPVFVHDFEATSTLQDVRDFVSEETGLAKFGLGLAYPRKDFTSEDAGKTLSELQLVPSSSLLVLPITGHQGLRASDSGLMSGVSRVTKVVYDVVAWLYNAVHYFLFPPPSYALDRGDRHEHLAEPDVSRNVGASSSERRDSVERGSNMARLRKKEEEKKDDDDTGTWNGNSTQQL